MHLGIYEALNIYLPLWRLERSVHKETFNFKILIQAVFSIVKEQ